MSPNPPLHAARTRRRGRGVILVPEDGVYAAIPVCRPSDWLHAVETALSIPTVEALRRRLRVAGPETVLAAARVWASAADGRTGRDVAISHAAVARTIGYAEATVKRIMRFLSRLGLVVECARGRNRLTLDELASARSQGAITQRAAASTRALTIPRSVDGTPLPLKHPVNETSPVSKNSPKRARRAQKAGAPRRPANDKRSKPASHQPRWPFAVQKFAAQLVDRLPRLLRTPRMKPQRVYVQAADGTTDALWIGGRHIGQVCDAITRHRLVERGWTAHQVLEAVDRYRASMRADIEPDDERDPLAWLFWLIGKTITVDELAPHAHSAAERERRKAAAAARHVADVELRERISAQESEIDAILAQMHRQFPRAPRTRRHDA